MMTLLNKIGAIWEKFDFLKFVKKGDDVLKFFGRVFIALLVIWILVAFRKAYKNESYIFQAFSVPPSLTERGYSGDVVVDKIMAQMQGILAKRYFDEQNPEAYRKVVAHPDLQFNAGSRAGYFDFQALFQMGKMLLGKKDKSIKGHITTDSNSVMLNLQMPDEPLKTFVISKKEPLEAVLQQAAIHLIKKTSPQYLVYYHLDNQDFISAENLLNEIEFKLNHTPHKGSFESEHIQYYMTWTNLLLAQKDFEAALKKAEILRGYYPKDLAAYAQTVNIITAKILMLENQGEKPEKLAIIASEGVEIAEQIEKERYTSVFLDKERAMGWVYANWAYLIQKKDPNSTQILPKYQKAIDLLPSASFAYNNLSYYFIDKKNYREAEEALKKALIAEPNDGNTWDTYAELMVLEGDSTRFYEYIEKALQNSNPTEGVTSQVYATDNRWAMFRTTPHFQFLLKKYQNKINGK